jgi:glutaredoxin 3
MKFVFRKAKQVLIGTYRIDPKHYNVIELDEHEHGELIQDALQRVTGGRSVPRVFIQGNFIGKTFGWNIQTPVFRRRR